MEHHSFHPSSYLIPFCSHQNEADDPLGNHSSHIKRTMENVRNRMKIDLITVDVNPERLRKLIADANYKGFRDLIRLWCCCDT